MNRHATAAIAIFVAVVTTPAGVAAEAATPLALTWVAPNSCPNADSVRSDVLRLAGGGTRATKRLTADATIEGSDDAWQLTLTTEFDGTRGERRLSAASCRALTDAAVLVMALILNPEAEAKTKPPPPAPGVEATKPASAPPSPPLDVRTLAGIHGGVHAGVTGTVGPTAGVEVGVKLEGFSLRVGGTLAPPARVYLAGATGPGALVWFVTVPALGCWELERRVSVGPCAGAAFTRLHGEGRGVTAPDSAVTRWVSVLLGVTAGVPLGRVVVLRGAGYALVPTRRPTLFFDDLGPVQRPAAVGVDLHAGVEVRLP